LERGDEISLPFCTRSVLPRLHSLSKSSGSYLGTGNGLTAQETLGLSLFNGKAKCATCHTSTADPASGKVLFTDFTYTNNGVPKNPMNPFYSELAFNPLGASWIDLGLGGYLKSAGYDVSVYTPELGKFKVPTLRNVDTRPSAGFVKAYGHNGYFKSLEQIVHFYNTRVLSKAQEPGSLVIVDSTGLRVYGKDEWHQEKHGVPARRTWRKLHLAVDENHQVLACELTTPEVGDPTAVPDLLAQIEAPFEVFMGDGAFDGETVSNAVLVKQPETQVVVPPHKTAVYSEAGDTQRDEHIRAIAAHGRIAWQRQNDYGLRSRVELSIQCYKRIIGNCMKARALPQQKTDLLRNTVALHGFVKEAQGCGLVALSSQQEVDCLAFLVHCAVEILPDAFDLDVGLVHAPAPTHGVVE